MKVGIIGCGYVFDHYLATWHDHPHLDIAGVFDRDPVRLATVARAYRLRAYPSRAAMLADPAVRIVVNLTSVESHAEVTRACLLAGKSVYSEKPLTTNLAEARELVELARERGLALSAAPSNALGDTAQTMWKAVQDGAVGAVRLVYAEFDDNPVYLMRPETWRSRTGAPWPYLDEYAQGCTHEHVGYHLTWLCAIFGPVASVTAFSKQVLPDKTADAVDPPDTPDFSVACLEFASGVVARVTCSIGAPLDHRMRVVGDRGMISADTYRHYRCPVYVETFSSLTLNARKAMSVRRSSTLRRLFGVDGRRVRLVRNAPPGSSRPRRNRAMTPGALVRRWRQYELGRQDKAIGVAELADALANGREHFPPPEFTLHVTELTLAIQAAGRDAAPYRPTTTFKPLSPRPETLRAVRDFGPTRRDRAMTRLTEGLLTRLHRH
ncbi:Gfo/Idh/MocA family oxidoreductase [Plantactinospora sp. GCM10030261]|uniref:Gfo/Idh/MocA family protein n=1 Tax=Plantactinospora sp. GCM10030261 TaxID=3273420 RepID=UPI00360B4C04